MPSRLLACVILGATAAAVQQQQPPVIKSGVELVLVDVQITGRDGQPVIGLKPEQFEVNIDGDRRPVLNAELITYRSGGTAGAPSSAAAAASTATPGAPGNEGRTIIIGVDQASLLVETEPAALEAVKRLLAMVSPEDSVGLVGYPQPGVSVAPTRDRKPVLDAAAKLDAHLQIPRTRMNISLAEAMDVAARDQEALRRLVQRFCPGDLLGSTSVSRSACALEVEQSSMEIAGSFEMQAMRSVSGLQSFMEAVRDWPGRKTVVLLSAGFASSDRVGGRPDIQLEADMLGKRSAEANAVIYALHLDVAFLQAFSAANAGRGLQTVFRNSAMLANGLERFTANAGGTLITVHAGPDAALKRLMLETSSYYLLSVEPLPKHRDGKVHRIQVKVKQSGAQVRSRVSVLIPKVQ